MRYEVVIFRSYEHPYPVLRIQRREPPGKSQVLVLEPEPHWQDVEEAAIRPPTLLIPEVSAEDLRLEARLP